MMPKKTIIRKNSRPKPLPIDKQAKFEIPEAFLSQLSEFTENGFVLITTPSDGGAPEVITECDNPTVMYGLYAFAKDFFTNSCKNMDAITDDFLGVQTS